MVEHLFSPFTPDEVSEKLSSNISSTPRSASWILFPKSPDNFYNGKVSSGLFYLTPASVHEKGNPTLEIVGVVTVADSKIPSSNIILRYRPGRVKLLCWICMLAIFFMWILFTLLHFNKTGVLSSAVILPVIGSLALLAFMLVYKKHVADSRYFLRNLLLLQTASAVN